MEVIEQANAKLNLTLDVTAKRDDGYHEIVSIISSVALCDTITIESGTGGGITLRCSDAQLPCGEKNLAFRAAQVFFAKTKCVCDGIHIILEKRIPAGSGLGGGSSDAAAVLRGLRKIYKPAMMLKELERMAADIGSDVPYCVRSVTSLVRGRGEQLLKLPKLPLCWFVIVKPPAACATVEMYAALDALQIQRTCDTAGMSKALEYQDVREISDRLYNAFEQVPFAKQLITPIKERLLSLGARNALMTGSGSAVYGLFTDEAAAQSACAAIQKDYPFICCAERV